MKLDVPYYSQHRDIKDANWQKRACGLVCLKMVLDFHKIKAPDINEFLKLSLEKEAYHQTNGWIHDKLLEIAESFGVKVSRKENMESEEKLKSFLDKDCPVIVSIKNKRFSPKFGNKFHQIVLTGYDEKGFFYNDSDYQNEDSKPTIEQGGKNLFVSFKKFQRYWRKMAIFVSKMVEN